MKIASLKKISFAALGLGLLLPVMSAQAMTLSSKDIKEGQLMSSTFEFSGFGCNGANQSPQLTWSDVPAGTKSFAITVYDPDAPSGSGWWHWSVVNVPASVTSIPRGVHIDKLGATEIRTDFGKPGYGGACPPQGDGMHRYQFTVWALPKAKLDLDANVSPALVGYTLNSMALDKAVLTATYVK